jgi:hypothetical protein
MQEPPNVEFARRFNEFFAKYRDFLVDDLWLLPRFRFRAFTKHWPIRRIKPEFHTDYCLLVFLRFTLEHFQPNDMRDAYILFRSMFEAERHLRNEPLMLDANELQNCRNHLMMLDAFCAVYLAEDRASSIALIPGSAGLSTRVDQLLREFRQGKFAEIPNTAQEIDRQASRLGWKVVISVIAAWIVFGHDIWSNITTFWNLLSEILGLLSGEQTINIIVGYFLVGLMLWFLTGIPERYFWGQFPPLLDRRDIPIHVEMIFWENRARQWILRNCHTIRAFFGRPPHS